MRYVGTTARGIRTGIIKEGDNLEKIVVDSVLKASESENFKIKDKDIIGVTEAVVGIASGNYVNVDDIATDIKNKFIIDELNSSYINSNLIIYEYQKPLSHIGTTDFYSHCENGIRIS